VTRLAQLVNDARDALIKDRAAYDTWLRSQVRPRVADAETTPEQSSPTADSSRFTWADDGEMPDNDVWDPWEEVRPQTPPQTPRRSGNQSGGRTAPDVGGVPLSAEERRRAWLAVFASLLCGPLGLWLGIRSYKRSRSVPAIFAIVIGGMSVLYLVSLAIAIALGLFSEPSTTSSSVDPVVAVGSFRTLGILDALSDTSSRPVTQAVLR
jgi:hypothetical protein